MRLLLPMLFNRLSNLDYLGGRQEILLSMYFWWRDYIPPHLSSLLQNVKYVEPKCGQHKPGKHLILPRPWK